MSDEARRLADQHGGVWSEHPQHDVESWHYHVANNDTRASYWDWVLTELETEPEA